MPWHSPKGNQQAPRSWYLAHRRVQEASRLSPDYRPGISLFEAQQATLVALTSFQRSEYSPRRVIAGFSSVWRKTIYHRELKASRVLRGETQAEVEFKAQLQLEAWSQKWQKIQQADAKRRESEKAALRSFQQKELAAERTREAQEQIAGLNTILKDGIEVDHVLDWDSLKDRSAFSVPIPTCPTPGQIPREPQPRDPVFQPRLSLVDRLIPSRRSRRKAEAIKRFRIEET